jgi:hypothetical protein
MTRDRADFIQLTFFLGIKSALEAWVDERRLFSIPMLPMMCASAVIVASMFLDVGAAVLVSAVLMLAMAGLIVETSAIVEEKAPIYFSFLMAGALILGFAAFHSGASALVDAPLAIIPIAAFFVFGGSSLVGLVRLLSHV